MKKHILIAEDDPGIKRITHMYLEKAGFRVSAVDNGRKALALISQYQKLEDSIDLLITDLHMPQLGGLELLDLLREKELTIPVIVVTAQDDSRTLKLVLRKGCYDFIEKPIKRDELLDRVEDLFQRLEKEKSKWIQGSKTNHFFKATPFECSSCGAEIEMEASDVFSDKVICPACLNTVMVPMPGIERGMEIGGFVLREKLGSGGMGSVWLAQQKSLKRDVAVKILSPALTKQKYFVKRFMQEIETAGKLEHPNIVTAFDAGIYNNMHYLAISYVDGINLEDKLKKEKVIPEAEALRIIRGVAEGLCYAWNKFGLLHRDIKPGNIMLDSLATPKVMDMGISKIIQEDSSLTITGVIVGSPFYMSPEQSRSERDINFRADLYSLGATFYHMITGVPPFNGENAISILTKHITEPLISPKRRNPKISDPCEALVEIMLAKNPDDRPTSWEALLMDINLVIKGKFPKTQRPDTTVRQNQNFDYDSFLESHSAMSSPPTARFHVQTIMLDADAKEKEEAKRKKRKAQKKEANASEEKYFGASKILIFFGIILLLTLFLVNVGILIGIKSARESKLTNSQKIKDTDIEMKKLDLKKRQAIKKIMEQLHHKADRELIRKRRSAAARVYIDYQGKYARETEAKRKKFAEECLLKK